MDKEQLARKLYVERVAALIGEEHLDDDILEVMWENKASPDEAANAMLPQVSEGEKMPEWVIRYLSRK